ncbi:dipeptide ABC transporter ATP-binding protein [Clostridium sp. 19966]|uniref:ABC transporter ATP-binding protein n=1 Tax=Clostridium sp. 19966 TaxID=2768166 RepID=UPI0028E07B95|nr:dipeptide ABC transporter ATP-binding protein [Clostridium sp. 19966]MDT8715877.1 dipeptide ABC transporter ATP-binding protein [Clostridium sp. 19966]
MEKLIQVEHVKKYFQISKKAWVKAVDDVSFDIFKGETLGMVGESGCGKSTMGRLMVNLIEPTNGQVSFQGQNISRLGKKNRKFLSKNIQMIFQDPYASLNPRMTVGDIIAEPMKVNSIAKGNKLESQVLKLLNYVGLASYHRYRFPHEFSGGQRQRIGIARALAVNPKIIVCDEPVSALDVSIQAQVLNLLEDLQKEFELTYLFIAHGLNVVRHISNRVGVMYLGKLVELSDVEKLYSNPLHPYSKSLLSAIPVPDTDRKRERIILEGEVPSPLNPPKGCSFNTRCSYCKNICKEKVPEMKEVQGSLVACHLYD